MASAFIANEIGGCLSHLVGGDDGNNDLDALDGPLDDDVDDGDESDEENNGEDRRNRDRDLLVGDIVDDIQEFVVGVEYERLSDDEFANDEEEQQEDEESTEPASAYLRSRDAGASDPAKDVPIGALSTWSKDLKLLEHAKKNLPLFDGSALLAPKKKKRMYNRRFNISVPLDRIVGRVFDRNEWIDNREAAPLVYDENARAKQTILKLSFLGNPVPPPRGLGHAVVPPNSLTEVRFEEWMMQTTPELYTINVVSTFHLGGPISLHRLAQRLLGALYSPLSFSALIMRDSQATYMLFLSGRVVVAGASSRMASFIACQSLVNLLNRCDMMAEVLEFSEQNDVATASAGFSIDLVKLARALPLYVCYSPTSFPGATLRFFSSQLVFIVFTGGKVIITGVASRLDSLVAWRWLHSYVLWHFELKTERYFFNEADYSRKERQRDSIVESVCQTICDITQSCIGNMLNENLFHPTDENTPRPDRNILSTIYEEHLDPEKRVPCIILRDDDDEDGDVKAEGAVKPENAFSTPWRPPNIKLEHPWMLEAHPFARRVARMCHSMDIDAEATEVPPREVIDVEKWLEDDEANHTQDVG